MSINATRQDFREFMQIVRNGHLFKIERSRNVARVTPLNRFSSLASDISSERNLRQPSAGRTAFFPFWKIKVSEKIRGLLAASLLLLIR